MRRKDSSPIIRVAAGVIERDGRRLIARRNTESHLGGLWEFPGGKCEPEESLEDCLRRELREELGIEITPPVLFHVIRHAYPEKTVELLFFECGLADGEPSALGCAEFRWVTPEQLQQFPFLPADASLIALLQQGQPLHDRTINHQP